MEHIIYRHIMDHLDSNSILVNYQHGFRQGHPCESQLITVIESVARNLDLGQQSDLPLLGFSKAFDTVPHQRLLNKLDFYGIRGNLKTWLEQWLTTRHQRVLGVISCRLSYKNPEKCSKNLSRNPLNLSKNLNFFSKNPENFSKNPQISFFSFIFFYSNISQNSQQ